MQRPVDVKDKARWRRKTYVTRVAMLLMQDMTLETIPQPRSDPCKVAGWWMIGPTPCAFTIHQMKKVMPAIGTTTAFSVKRCRLGVPNG